MNQPHVTLPAEVVAAIAAGKKIEAVRLLRDKTGISLAAAKQAVEAHDLTIAPASTATGPSAPALAGNVLAELARGNKIEAIKLLRQGTGLGLKEAKDAVDAAHAALPGGTNGNLAPGEVPRTAAPRLWRWLLAAAALAAAYGYFELR